MKKAPIFSSLAKVIRMIREVVFGRENYCKWKALLNTPNFEYNSGMNYVKLLNPKYFYNLPDLSLSVPMRNYILFGDDGENQLSRRKSERKH